jgi:hypothetical protein
MRGHSSIPTQEQIDHVLVFHQTIQEREFGHDPPGIARAIWLRTYYAPELNATYDDIFGGVDSPIVDPEYTLDDKDLYAFEHEWDRVLNTDTLRCVFQ